MQILKRTLLLFAIFFSYIVVRELLELYVLTSSVHPLFGYATLAVILGFIVYFIVIPVYRILTMPANLGPSLNSEKDDELIRQRIKQLRKNQYLRKVKFDFEGIENNKAGYEELITRLAPESERIRKRYVLQLFYSSSVSQNGFLDAILILSSSINLVRELFVLYHGRVGNKDLLAIARRVYMSMAIGGTEGVEYAGQQIFSKFATESVKSVPFADKIFGSLADGFVNAALLTRISLITENYCRLVTIESERELYPSPEFILKTTQFITADIFDRMTGELLRMSKEKTIDYVMFAVNPVAHLFSQTVNKVTQGANKVTAYPKEMLKDVAQIANKPLIYSLDRVASVFRKK